MDTETVPTHLTVLPNMFPCAERWLAPPDIPERVRENTDPPADGRPSMATDRIEADRCLDVREIDGDPFGEITGELETLPDDETLLLINGFEPKPLYEVLEDRGFRYETTSDASEESEVWRIRIRHEC